MCGIAGVHVLQEGYEADLYTLADWLLMGIDHRGGDATGAACFGPYGVQVQKASCRAWPFLKEWRGVPAGTRTVLLHTRYATQGSAAFPENNHPVAHGSVHVVHNGHINNDAAIFAARGKERIGRVDSEAIPAVIVAAGWDNPGAGLEDLSGAFAIAAVDEKRPGELLLAKGGWSPLVWFSNGRLLVWASEGDAILKAWRKAIGSPPKGKRLRYAVEGDLIRVRGGDIQEGRFHVPVRVSYSHAWDFAGVGGWPNRWAKAPGGKPKETATSQGAVSCEVREAPGRSVVPVSTRLALPKPSDPDLGETLAAALATIEGDRPGSVGVWSTEHGTWEQWTPGVDDPGIADVRCGCCDEWGDPLEMEEHFGELLCWQCQAALVEDGVIEQK